MASVHKMTNGRYRVLWREDDRQRQKNFQSASEAKRFAATIELSPEKKSSRNTVADWLAAYRDTESVHKHGAKQECLRINRFIERPFAVKKLTELTRGICRSILMIA